MSKYNLPAVKNALKRRTLHQLAEAFRKGAELISPRGSWARGSYYVISGPFVARCVLGAARKQYAGGDDLEQHLFGTETWSPFEHARLSIAGFNDAPTTTQEDAIMASLFIAEYLKSEADSE